MYARFELSGLVGPTVSPQVLESLLQRGAQVDAIDASGATPLMHAINNNHGDATGLLCDYGADVSGFVPGI